MKVIVVSICLMFASLVGIAQKVDLDRFNFKVTNRFLPTEPLKKEYNTYDVTVASSSVIREVYNDDLVKSGITINGLKKVNEQGHITVNLTMGDVTLRDPQLKEREEINKDKDGKEISRTKYYWIEAIYTWNASSTVTDYKGNNLYSYAFARGEANVWKGTESTSPQVPGDFYNNNRYSIRSGLASTLATNTVNSFRNILTQRYGFSSRRDNDFMWILDNKKHPENVPMQAAFNLFKQTIEAMTEEEDLEPIKVKLQPAIAYFDSLKVRITGTEKGDKKLRYAAYYFLMKMYIILDNPDAAIKEADLLIANDYDDSDGKTYKKSAEYLKASLAKNNVTTRHFAIDVSGYKAPASN